jgi:molybdate transport system ATP-binding protein
VSRLTAALTVHRGQFTLDAALDVAAGTVVALLGPNGAGKTTALRALAGLQPLTAGEIRLDGAVLDAPARRVFVPANRRAVGVVFQDYLLFPHLSAVDNVAFGLRCRRVPRTAARRAAERWLDRVGLLDQAAARPGRLSGGQAQRVALARALATEPRLLLLDEPLAALDALTRPQVRAQLGHLLRGAQAAPAGGEGAYPGGECAYPGGAAVPDPAVTILVTHDPLDAMVLADRIVVLEAGRIVQDGPPVEITRHPRTDYVARLVGLNLYRGAGAGHTVTLPDGTALTVADPVRGPAFVAFPPAAVALHRTRPDGSPRNTWLARVGGVDRHGDNVRVTLDGPIAAAADVTPAAAAELELVAGRPVWAAVKAAETRAYPA